MLTVAQGLCESSAWPGVMILFMHWYTPTELAKRMGFYHSCQALGNMLSGALQAAIMSTLDANSGLAGWRWLFIVNCIITVVWKFWASLCCRTIQTIPIRGAFWFNKQHGEMAITRLIRHKRAEPRPVTLASAKRTFSGWIVYFKSVLYTGTVLATYGYVYFGLFLQAMKKPDGSPRWSIEEFNIIPTGGGANNVVFVWIWALLSDFLRTRWTLVVTQSPIGVASSVTISIWTSQPRTTPLPAAYAGYFINYICLVTAPLIFAWLSDLIPQDPEARSLTVGVAVASYYAVSAWSQVLVWPASQAPYYKHGWESCIVIWILCISMTCILRFVDVRYLRPKREAFADALRHDNAEVAGRTAVLDKDEQDKATKFPEASIRGTSLSD